MEEGVAARPATGELTADLISCSLVSEVAFCVDSHAGSDHSISIQNAQELKNSCSVGIIPQDVKISRDDILINI